MCYQGIQPTVLINPNRIDFHRIVKFFHKLNSDVVYKKMSNDMISKYWEQPPEVLVMGTEDVKIIVDLDILGDNLPCSNIPLLGISSSKSNTILKRFLGLGGEAVIYQNNNIILAKGAAAHILESIDELNEDHLHIRELLLYHTIAHCLNIKISDLGSKKPLETVKA